MMEDAGAYYPTPAEIERNNRRYIRQFALGEAVKVAGAGATTQDVIAMAGQFTDFVTGSELKATVHQMQIATDFKSV